MALGKRAAAAKAHEGPTKHKKSCTAPAHDNSNHRMTRSKATDAARQAVFNTSELLERIIVHLPMKSIFPIQRVSQKSKAVVDISPSVQTKVFRHLQNTPAETWIEGNTSAHGMRKLDAYATPTKIPMRGGKLLRPVVLNPLLKVVPRPSCFPRPWTSYPGGAYSYFSDDTALWSGREFVEIDVQQGLLGNDPNFLKTYITDPPNRKARVAIGAEYQLEPDSEPETRTVV